MLTLLAFVVTIVVIVAFHEWGHFLAMRAFGVRVLTFSVGFGPRLARFTDKKGTDWVISAIPWAASSSRWTAATTNCPRMPARTRSSPASRPGSGWWCTPPARCSTSFSPS